MSPEADARNRLGRHPLLRFQSIAANLREATGLEPDFTAKDSCVPQVQQKGSSVRAGKRPSHSLSSGLEQVELLALFAQHFHVEVAMGFEPVLVDFDR